MYIYIYVNVCIYVYMYIYGCWVKSGPHGKAFIHCTCMFGGSYCLSYIYIIYYIYNIYILYIRDWGIRHPGVAGGDASAVSPIAFRPELNSSQEGSAPLGSMAFSMLN